MSYISKEVNILVLYRMAERYELFGIYKYVIPIKSQDWNIILIYILKDESMTLSVKELSFSFFLYFGPASVTR